MGQLYTVRNTFPGYYMELINLLPDGTAVLFRMAPPGSRMKGRSVI